MGTRSFRAGRRDRGGAGYPRRRSSSEQQSYLTGILLQLPGALKNENPRVVRLGGLPIELLQFPDPTHLPSTWQNFEAFSFSNETPVVSFSYQTEPCPFVITTAPLNDSPYFKVYQHGDTLLGVPESFHDWRAIYQPEPSQLNLYVDQSYPSLLAPGPLADLVLWRFRTLVLGRYDRMIFHAMAAMKDGKAFLFAGDSGTGKSTLARLLDQAGWTILSDESPILEALPDGGFRAWGSPWPSSGGFATNQSAPLAACYFLSHGLENKATPLTPGAAVKCLLGPRLVFFPWYLDAMRDRLLDLLEHMVCSIPCLSLDFRPDHSIASFLDGHPRA